MKDTAECVYEKQEWIVYLDGHKYYVDRDVFKVDRGEWNIEVINENEEEIEDENIIERIREMIG